MTDKRIRIILDSKDAQKNAEQFDNSMSQAGKSADVAAFSVKRLASAIAAVVASQKLIAFISDSIAVTRQFEKSISELSAITGATGADLKFLSDAAREFGETTTLSATEAATALKLMASAKPDLLENIAALKATTKESIALAEAAGIDLPSATQSLGNALNQFSADASEAGRFINVLAAGAKFGSSEISNTAMALKEAGTSADAAKVSFEQTNAAIQVLASRGIVGAQAGTALRNVFLKLDTSLDKNIRPSVVGLDQALDNLAAKNLDTTQLVKLFGLENINAGRAILEQRDALTELTSKLTGTNTAYEQQRINTDNLDGDIKALSSSYESLQITLGTLFNGSTREGVQNLTDATRYLSENMEGVLAIVELLSVAVGARLAAAVATSAAAFVSSIKAEASAINEANAAAARATVSVNKFTGAITRSTVQARTATVATQLMAKAATAAGSAMALLGGPVGIISIAVASLISYAMNSKDAATANEVLSESVDNLTRAQADNLKLKTRDALEAEKQKIIELKAEIDKLGAAYENYNNRGGQASRNNAKAQARVSDEIERTKVELGLAVENAEKLEKRLTQVKTVISDFGVDQDPFGFGDANPFTFFDKKTKPDTEVKEDKPKDDSVARAQSATAALQRELDARRQISAIYRQGEIDAMASQFEQERAIQSVEEQVRIAEAEAKYAEDLARREERFLASLESDIIENEQKKALKAEFENQNLISSQLLQQELTAIEQRGAKDREQIAKMEMTAKINTWSSMASSGLAILQSFGSKSFQSQKNFAIANSIVSIASGVAQALNNPYPANLAFAAQVGIQGAGLINTIRSSKPGGGGSAPSVSSASPPASATASAVQPQQQAQPARVQFTIENDIFGVGNKINEALKELQRNGVQIAGSTTR
jgi:TP901 family phage tail tape measure protein